MIQLIDVDKKEQLAKDIKDIIYELNKKIHLANDYHIRVRIIQNNSFSKDNSDVTAFISESVNY